MTDLVSREPELVDDAGGGLESAADTPRSERRFPCLDGYRALAALLVLVSHVGFQTGRSIVGPGHSILARGDLGVPLFFTLSGFLLYRPMAAARLSGRPLPRVHTYLVRRLLRIVPAFWVSVTVVLLVLSINAGPRREISTWIFHLGFAQIYPIHDRTGGLSQNWSLDAEMSFYLALPFWPRLVALADRRKAPKIAPELFGLATLVILTIGWILFTDSSRHPFGYQTGYWLPEHLDWFAAGMFLAIMSLLPDVRPAAAQRFRSIYELADSPGTSLLVAAGLYLMILTPLGGTDDLTPQSAQEAVIRELLFGLFAFFLVLPGVLGDQRRGAVRAVLKTTILRRLGEASYGIFLWHMGVIYFWTEVLHEPIFTPDFPKLLALTLALTLPLAFASLYLVERPALRLKARLTSAAALPSTRIP